MNWADKIRAGIDFFTLLLGSGGVFGFCKWLVKRKNRKDTSEKIDKGEKPDAESSEVITPITPDEKDSTFSSPQPQEPDFEIRPDEANDIFVLVNKGVAVRHISVFASAKDGAYTQSWRYVDWGRSDLTVHSLHAYGFFEKRLPELRQERQQSGTKSFDRHVESGDRLAHYQIEFTVTWKGGEQTKTITVN